MMMGAGCVSSCFGCCVVRSDSIAAAVINMLLPRLSGATTAVTKMQCLAGAMATAASCTTACAASRR